MQFCDKTLQLNRCAATEITYVYFLDFTDECEGKLTSFEGGHWGNGIGRLLHRLVYQPASGFGTQLQRYYAKGNSSREGISSNST